MRTRLFRGFAVYQRKWIFGSLIEYTDDFGNSIKGIVDHSEKGFVWYEVHAESVGEWIGITNRYGSKLFEHDHVMVPESFCGDTRYKQTIGIIEFDAPNYYITGCAIGIDWSWTEVSVYTNNFEQSEKYKSILEDLEFIKENLSFLEK